MTRGFTLLELMVILAVSLLVGGTAIFMIPGLRSRTNLDLATQEIIGQLRDAQSNSISQAGGAKWGVRLIGVSNDNDRYAVFSGDSFLAGTITTQVSLPSNLKFLDPSENNSKDIIFSKVTGVTAPVSIIISLIDNANVFNTININANGAISYSKTQ